MQAELTCLFLHKVGHDVGDDVDLFANLEWSGQVAHQTGREARGEAGGTSLQLGGGDCIGKGHRKGRQGAFSGKGQEGRGPALDVTLDHRWFSQPHSPASSGPTSGRRR
jgi:hypothetical protein